jgi:hypothetical protein
MTPAEWKELKRGDDVIFVGSCGERHSCYVHRLAGSAVLIRGPSFRRSRRVRYSERHHLRKGRLLLECEG